MQQLSQAGQQIIDDIAKRHGFSTNAIMSMLESVINGNGSMAQFNHPEFSGGGQWMSGGMTMVSDMFNNYLKGRVDALCSELARLVANQPDLLRSGSFQSQSQGGQGGQSQDNYAYGGNQSQGSNAQNGGVSLFVPPAPGKSADWWPADLRWPNSTGSQNGVRYAHFAQAHRLVIDVGGKVTVYDTLDHQIGSFSQQQSYGGSLSFSSQYGLIDVASLSVISIDGVPQNQAGGNNNANLNANNNANNANQFANQFSNNQPAPPANVPVAAKPFASVASVAAENDIFAMIDRLADLRSRSVLTEDEFIAKKTELLSRL
jgi:hypothetical protein